MKKLQLTTKQVFIVQLVIVAIYLFTKSILKQTGILNDIYPVTFAFFILTCVSLFVRRYLTVDGDKKSRYITYEMLGMPEKYHKKLRIVGYIFLFAVILYTLYVFEHYKI